MGIQPLKPKARAEDEVEDWASRSDEDLLTTIAGRRNKAAFTELFNRHHARAYKIAYYLVANAALAEEIVQEAMFAVWMQAEKYQPTHARAEAWLMRVVANRGLRVVRREQNEKKRLKARMNEPKATESPNPAEAANRLELHRTLWEMLAKLPLELRQMLVLYYVGEMTQAEISNLMKLPQSTVSVRIQDALERLRLNLKSAGLASAVPALSSELFAEAIGSVGEVPHGIQARVLKRISTRSAARSSGKAAAPLSAWKGVWVGAVALLAVVCGVFIRSIPETSPPAAAPAESGQAESKATPPGMQGETLSAGKEKLHASWDFERGPHKEMRLRLGEWKWKAGRASTGAGMYHVPQQFAEAPRDAADASQRFAVVEIPCRIPSGPVRLTAKVSELPQEGGRVDGHEPNRGFMLFAWCNSQESIRFTCWKLSSPASQDELNLHTYVLGRYLVTCFNSSTGPIFFQEFESARPADRICFAFKNLVLQKLEVRELEDAEVPEAIRDPAKLVPLSQTKMLTQERIKFEFQDGQ